MRNLHLWLGLGCGLFLLVYAVSAVKMSHGKWWNSRPSVTQARVTLPAAVAASARTAARRLMDQHGMRGELQQVTDTAAGFRFRLARPGTVHEVQVDRASGEAQVR